MTKAVANINNVLAPQLVKAGLDPVEQKKIDTMMLGLDGTENKNSLGANAILGVSMAVCKAGAAHKGNYRFTRRIFKVIILLDYFYA